MYGENLGTGTLKKMLVRIATAINNDETYLGDTIAEDCRYLMEGAAVLWLAEKEDDVPECRTKRTLMYKGTPYERYGYVCEHTGEEYAMGWMPRNCPECGGLLVVTGEEMAE